MRVGDRGWLVTRTDQFRLAVKASITAGSYMHFAGASGDDFVNGIWKPGTVKTWLGTKGSWKRKFVYSEDDRSLIEQGEQDPSFIFPAEAFTPLDQRFNDLSSLVFDYDENEVRWDWNPSIPVYPAVQGILNNHVMKYPFEQTAIDDANLACLIVRAQPEEVGAIWESSVVSTEIANVIVENPNSALETWFVSVFEPMQTTDGRDVERGIFYRLTNDVELKKSVSANRVIVLTKKSINAIDVGY